MQTANDTMAERKEGSRERGMICDVPCLADPHTPRLLAEMPAQTRSGKTQLFKMRSFGQSPVSLEL